MLSLPRLLYTNKFGLPELPPPGTFTGQTILITGATSGLGLATAQHFLALSYSNPFTTVIITGRSLQKAEAAKAAIVRSTSNIPEKYEILPMELNMSSFSGVKSFVEEVKKVVKRIDYVLLNAGVMKTSWALSEEGFEETLQVNTLSTALLGILLIPWMKEVGGGKAHLGIVTSGLHRGVKIDESHWPQTDIIPYFSQENNWPGKIPGQSGMYAISKLLAQYVARELAKLALGPDGNPQVIVNSMCPGMVKSDLSRSYKTSYLMSTGVAIFSNAVMKSTEGGARTLVLAAVEKENGRYVTHYQSDEEYKIAVEKNILSEKGQNMQAQVWTEILDTLEKSCPEVKDIVYGGLTGKAANEGINNDNLEV